jgi:hypothetical protein
MACLPTVEELEKLPLRAVVAYASGSARRLCRAFRGDPAEAIVYDALALAESVMSAESVAEVDVLRLMGAAREIMEALTVAGADIEKHAAGYAAFCAVRTAWAVVDAASGSSMQIHARRAVREAQRAARTAELFDEPQATSAVESARREYIALVGRFGKQTEVVIGEPFRSARAEDEPDTLP